MSIGRNHPRSIRPLPDISLLIGQGGDLSLMSAMIQSPAITRKLGPDRRPVQGTEWQWVHNFDDAQRLARTRTLKAIVADASICSEHHHLVDSRNRAVPIRLAATELERMLGRVSVRHGGAATNDNYIDPSATRRYEVAKRILDVVVSLTVLTVAAIPVILAYVLFCLCFGPSTFSATRTVVGENGRSFRYRQLSFVPTRLAQDSRRHRVAVYVDAAMNRTHLNLAATLTNVLADEMSLVGPRAVDSVDIERGTEVSCSYPQRFVVKPGLVSLASVRFRYSDSPRDIRLALEYDLYYIKNRSIKLDVRVLGRGFFLVEIDVLKTFAVTIAVAARAIRGSFHRVTGSAVRPSRIASVAMPIGEKGQPLDLKPTLIIGAGQGGKLIASELQRDHNSGLWPVAFVDDDPALLGGRVRGIPVLGNTTAIAAVASREHIEIIVLAIPSASELELQRIADAARDTGIPVLTMPSVGNILRGDDATRLRAVETSDLLGRPVVETDAIRARAFLGGKRVLVTGAAGSIGREVVRQALRGEPETIYGLDINESDLYDLQQELKATTTKTRFVPIVASVTQPSRLHTLMTQIRPQVVFHAAAYKHVPLMEDFPHEAVQSNIQGTWNVAQAAARVGVERFVLVSTDKAVRPSSVMGASKRIAELVVRDIAASTGLSACAVRFGNVLGSRGSVIPLFEKQIAAGGPVTITDKRMTRYFMTIPEAAGLIIEAGAFGDSGVIYMLEMGEPVRIVDVADRLIRLHGKRPGTDIELAFTGLRPGEKLFEELSLDMEAARETGHPKIRILDEGTVTRRQPVDVMMRHMLEVIEHGTPAQIRTEIMRKVQIADGVDTSLITPLPEKRQAVTA